MSDLNSWLWLSLCRGVSAAAAQKYLRRFGSAKGVYYASESELREVEGATAQEIKALLKQLRAVNPAVDMNIFRSVENVNLQTIISYHRGEEYHHFLDDYEDGMSIRGTKAEDGE